LSLARKKSTGYEIIGPLAVFGYPLLTANALAFIRFLPTNGQAIEYSAQEVPAGNFQQLWWHFLPMEARV